MIDIVMCSGRFNPPTDGHRGLFQKVNDLAVDGLRGEIFLIDGVGSSADIGRNPLSIEERSKIIKRWFPKIRVDFATNAFDIFSIMEVQNKNIVKWVVGEDRRKGYTDLLKQKNHVAELIVASRTAEDISATKAREFAISGDFDGFCSMMPSINSLEDNLAVMNLIRGKHELWHMTLPHLQLLK